MKKYVWTYPVLIMLVTTLLAMFMQSCGVVELGKMHTTPSLEDIDDKIRRVSWMLGFVLITGFGFCYYIYAEVKGLEFKIKKLTQDRE